ncbi:MAG: radical SAM protein [Bacteroidia bacterium]
MESFYSVQGEGAYSGTPAYFIRLGGCDVGCVWCDVKDSWDADKHPHLSVEQIVADVKNTKAQIVVVTGGEPAMYNLNALCDALHANHYAVHIETSGCYTLQGEFDWITFSPKKFKAPIQEVMEKAHELKIIVFNQSDFKWAEEFKAKVPSGCALYLQPEWSKKDQMQELIFNYVLKHPEWKISLQTHKYLGVD